jgi:peroxiredoxin
MYYGEKPSILPAVDFRVRVRDEKIGGPNPYKWDDVSSYDLFARKKVVIFSLPGAFTPTCSTMQLPGFEKNAAAFYDLGINDIYCVSVNDSFVMNKWAELQELENIKVIPDGSGRFTEQMNMLVDKDNLGFGRRSWRYAIIANNGRIDKWFIEPGMEDNCATDPYGETSPENILNWLKAYA